MLHEPERRQGRSENALRSRREELQRRWDERVERDIAIRAYQLYELRGGQPGHDLDDWLQAEREIRESLHRSTAA
jgi:Protein of unknown function (DUF2934)